MRSSMRTFAVLAGALALAAAPRAAAAAECDAGDPTVATFSIVAFDSATGDLGVAVASRVLACGAVVPYARAGVGAVATQALANPTFGPRGLALLESGKSAQQALDLLIESDPGSARRQVGVIDARGHVASFTGDSCLAWAGGVQGLHYAAQGNILTGEDVVRGMGRAFETTRGPLDERLIAALRAAEAAGGDSRGKQSAAILVVRAKGGYNGMNDRFLDLRVDDHTEPVEELARVHGIWRLQRLMTRAFEHYEKQQWDEAIVLAEEAMTARPDDAATRYNLACFCARDGRTSDALAQLAKTIEIDASYRALAANDGDFASLRKDKRWKALIAEPNAAAATDDMAKEKK
jgi:uncharacterized Ntn-hydrolase superfamily protein